MKVPSHTFQKKGKKECDDCAMKVLFSCFCHGSVEVNHVTWHNSPLKGRQNKAIMWSEAYRL